MRLQIVALALLWACSTPPGDLDVNLEVASGQLGLVRQVSWPGGGTELTVKVTNPEGGPSAEELAEAFQVSTAGGGIGGDAITVEREVLGVGVTTLLIKPAATAALRASQVQELARFVLERPTSEAISLMLWRTGIEQLANFTLDRERLQAKLDLVLGMEPAAVPLELEEALRIAEAHVALVGGRAPRGIRALVLSGAEVAVLPPTRSAVIVGTEQASARIEEFANSSYYRVSLCHGEPGALLNVMVDSAAGVLPVLLANALPESNDAACDVATIGPNLRLYPKRIELEFTDAQRQVYDERVAALSKADFDLAVRLDGSAPITASAHLRGKGTLGCERKSYTLSLDGAGRHLLPNSRTDEFYLLSMCADDRYVEQYTANQLLSELGLFPLVFRYVEVVLDDATQGVYLLLEKPREEIVRDGAGIHDVMRRRFETNPPADYFESKYTTGFFDAPGTYSAAVSEPATLHEHLNIEQYLRFLALMTAYQNGDYIDEIWVAASEQRVVGDSAGLWFETMAWDNDDLFSDCHYEGRFAFVDPNDLVYCAEATIDHALLADPVVYSRYVDILEDVLRNRVPPERFDAATEATAGEILPILARDGVSAALVRLVEDNPGAVDPAEAQRDVSAKLEALRGLYRSRHGVLLERIGVYRGANP
tara:strand:+ start:84288 stop:86246 length:1959 start_codon:yes stop_codon:yes gene_type:complete